MRRRSWWGWGYEGEGLSEGEMEALAALAGSQFGVTGSRLVAPALGDVDLPAPRIEAPGALGGILSSEVYERASHAYGKSYRDVVRALHGQIDHPPDLVARPRTEMEVVSLLDWCGEAGIAAIPYGGGSSVVGGVEPDVGEGYAGTVSIDLGKLNEVREVDEVSLAARIQAGVLGPDLERQLRPYGLTLRHFPQSFECSTLGGWIATRAAGHFATGPTHIDDLVESLRVVTPAGVVETRRLPASGAGPSPDRMFVGSEGALGIITEAWVRVRPRPRWRFSASARFESFLAGAACVRALAQSGLMPSNCRLVDPVEAMINGAGSGSSALLLIGFESADHPVGPWAALAEQCVRDHGGVPEASPWNAGEPGTGTGGGWLAAGAGSAVGGRTERSAVGGETETGRPAAKGSGAGGAWRSSFMRAPYMRDALVTMGVMCETFETAVTWDRFESLHEAVGEAVGRALSRGPAADAGRGAGRPGASGASGAMVTCRVTHAYPDGLAPYYTVLAPAVVGGELAQWDEVKAAASEAVLAAGGTITHHHAVGRDHRPWYDRQRPELFGQVLRAVKETLDPAGICNPGVLIGGSEEGYTHSSGQGHSLAVWPGTRPLS